MRGIKQLTVVVAAAGLAAASLLTPTPTGSSDLSFHIQLFVETILASISVGGGILFLTGLSGFKVNLRVAYTLIALGMVVYALALVQLPVLQVMNLFSSHYVSDGWLNLLYDLAALLLLLGVLRYAALVQARSVILTPLVIIATVALAAFLAPQLPHSGDNHTYRTLSALRINVSLIAGCATLLTFAALGLLIVKRTAGPAYTNALAWSFLGVGALAIATISTVYFQLNGFTGAYVTTGSFFLPFLVGVICNLRAAVAFNDIKRF